jgi:hypothetical protein
MKVIKIQKLSSMTTKTPTTPSIQEDVAANVTPDQPSAEATSTVTSLSTKNAAVEIDSTT